MPKLVNLFGAPCAGKTTAAHGLMYKLKSTGIKSYYVPEFATELVMNNDDNSLQSQDYIFGEQYRRIRLALKHFDVIVTDGPLLLASFYDRKYQPSIDRSPLFADLVKATHDSLDNINVFFDRIHPYDPTARYQTDEESMQIQIELQMFLLRNQVDYISTVCKEPQLDTIVNIIKEEM